MTSADFSRFVVTTVSLMRPHGLSHISFLVYLQNLRFRVTVTFWTLLPMDNSSAFYALYSVPVRQATISLFLPLSHISRCETCKSLLDSSVTTPRRALTLDI